MKLHSLLVVSVALAIAPLASASVICTYGPDGDGALTLHNNADPVWDEGSSTWLASMDQHSWPGHMLGAYDDGTDGGRPIIWVRNTVYNDGEIPPFVWTDFHLNITMDHPFTISGTATLPDWIVQNVAQPVEQQPNVWLGTVDYLGGTPINFGDWGEFDVQLSFSGPIQYTIEMIPTPEPAALLLLGLGACLLRGRRS